METITFRIDAPIPSRANERKHWAEKRRITKAQRDEAQMLAKSALRRKRLAFPVTVLLTRVSPRELDDDNLRGAFKAFRDGIADALGVDDRDPRVKWQYAQEKGKPQHAEIQIREANRETMGCYRAGV